MEDKQERVGYEGRVLEGKYKLIEKLGEGGMGAVYLGMHQLIGKKVAVKFLHKQYATNQEVVTRFYREARAAAEIGHRSIIDVLDMGVSPDGEPYLVMEYLEGESLGALLRRNGPLDLATSCGVMEQALFALQAAHEKGIVHRDLKPENIFISIRTGESPTVKIIDFGISKITSQSRDTKLTHTGSLLGTPSYMSPEQARGDTEIDHRSDIYSIGVVLYQMLTGCLPFEGTNYNRLLIKVLTEDPIPPSRAYPAFPKEAEPVVLRAMSKAREDRYQSAAEMLKALSSVTVFNSRTERLTSIASGLRMHTFATGDLGPLADSDSGKALAALFDRDAKGKSTPKSWEKSSDTRTSERRSPVFSEGTTPKAWSGTLEREMTGKNSTVTYMLVGIAVVSALVIAVGVGYYGLFRGQVGSSSAASPSVSSPASVLQPASATITIRVEGAPSAAKIYFDGARVEGNPFVIRKEAVFLPLSVEAEGYESYKVRISADRDQVVKVALKPVWRNVSGRSIQPPEPLREPAVDLSNTLPTGKPEPTYTRKPAAPRRVGSSTNVEKPKSTLQKASRGANLAEEFE